MKSTGHSEILLEALLQVREILDAQAPKAQWVSNLRRIILDALTRTATPDPLMAAAAALGKSVQVLEGELVEASAALKEGRIWVCMETPGRLKQAREAIAAARAAGAVL